MKTQQNLPTGYSEILSIDLQKNKSLALTVNGIALLIAVIMLILGIVSGPGIEVFIKTDTNSPDSITPDIPLIFSNLLILGLGTILYVILHELVHGIFMYAFSGVKPHYGFNLMYAYAGSSAYFSKLPYIIIALSPVVIWGIVLAVLNFILPKGFFYSIYFIQMLNVSGAAGDIFVTARFLRLPKDILINDTGVSMTVYSSNK